MAAVKSGHILFALLSLAAVAVPIVAGSGGPLLGGWRPIDNPNANKVVVDTAKFAVEEYNKDQKKSLVFVSVVKGDEQEVAGIKFRFIISAKDGNETGNYIAVVYYKLVTRNRELISFQKEHRPYN